MVSALLLLLHAPQPAESQYAYLEVLVRGLLPFLVQSSWLLTCEVSSKAEEGASSENTHNGVCKDLGVLTWRSLRTRSMGPESDPVSCTSTSQQLSSTPLSF